MKSLEIAYIADPTDLFSHVAHQPYAALLDSCVQFNRLGRFDIMAWQPQSLFQGDDLNQLKAALPSTTNDSPFPIHPLAIGYVSYDYGWRLETLPQTNTHDIHFPDMTFVLYQWSIVTDHHTQQSWIAYLPSQHPQPIVDQIQRLLQAAPKAYDPFILKASFRSNMSYSQYQQAFNRIAHHIQQGDCYQANLAQRFEAPFIGSPWNAYLQCRRENPSPFAAYLHYPFGHVLSLSPERFLQLHHHEVETKPIKGTMKRAQQPELDRLLAKQLQHSEKDRAENMMIVDLLRNDIGKICVPGSVNTPRCCDIESFPNVHHLVSTVTGTLRRDATHLDLLQACFPGGSITGAPKIRAMEIIEACEPHHRSVYCGSIAYLDANGNMDSNIAIRTLICQNQTIYCYAGGGIVHDSQCKSEYEETLIKVDRLLQALKREEHDVAAR